MKPSHRLRPFWRRRLVVPLLALLGLNVATLALYTLPRSIEHRRIAERAAVLRGEVERQRVRVRALREQAETMGANARDAERFYREVVGARKGVTLEKDLEKLAGELGLHPHQYTFRREDVKGVPLEKVVVTMPLAGTYKDVLSFLERVERSPHFLTVDQVQVRGREEGSADLNIVLSAYFRLDKRGRHAS